MNFQPTGDRVLVRRLPKEDRIIEFADPPTGVLIAEGVVIAVGPGEYDDDGDFCPTTVRPGQHVYFNARWNDFASGELVGTDCDGKGPLERPMPQWQWMAPPGVSTKPTKDMYLITEGDIAGVLS